MKKILILSGALCVLASTSANAQVSVAIGVPVPGYVMAPDWPSQHYDHHRHNHNDYWARIDQEKRDRAAHDNRDHDRR